jgi:hypothetical protein
MSESIKISCTIDTSNSAVPLGMEIWVDNTCVLDLDSVKQQQVVETVCSDAVGEHELRFILKNKKPEHTKISPTGDIVEDAVLCVSDIRFDGVALGKILSDLAVYTHSFNSTDLATQHPFYGTMGCNGTVSLKFSTPIYIWLLENM